VQVQDHRQIQPPLTGPDIADVARPFLVGPPGNPVLRRPADDLASAERGPRRECEAHPEADAAHAPDADYQKPDTSKPAKGHKTYPYLLGGLRVERPNQVWCADITYLPMRRGFLYLVAIMDWYTRKVLAWRISNTLEVDFCVEALNEAIHKFGLPEIMNTDQGSQFTSCAWTDRLKRVGSRISMDGKGRCLDNIFIERLWRSLKYECVYLHAWQTGSQAKAGVSRWITFYNHHRPHTAHAGQPPAVVYFSTIETDQQVQAVA